MAFPPSSQPTHSDGLGMGDKLEDAQGLQAISNVEIEVFTLDLTEHIGDEDNDQDDHVQQVIAIFPIADRIHVDLHEEFTGVDGHKDHL